MTSTPKTKNPQSRYKALRIAPCLFILRLCACTPLAEVTAPSYPGRSSGYWIILLTAPSQGATPLVGSLRPSSPNTAAGPPLIHTGFPLGLPYSDKHTWIISYLID